MLVHKMAAVDLSIVVASQALHSDVNETGHHRADFWSCASGRRAGHCLEKSSLRLQVENDIIVMYAVALGVTRAEPEESIIETASHDGMESLRGGFARVSWHAREASDRSAWHL